MAEGFQAFQSTAAAVDAAVAPYAMLSHAFYRAWEEGKLSHAALREYSRQYFHHVEAFPRAVSATHAQCPDVAGRRMLAENLAEEEGLGEGRDAHADLWLDFAAALGADEAEVRAAHLHPETQALIDTFRTLSRQSYAAGLGALYAYESQLPAIAATKIAGLERYGVREARGVRFFAVHEEADVAHAAVCRQLLDALPAGERAEAVEAGAALAQALYGFLDGMERSTPLV
ncbi:MAG: CADD family putative folate metabolism protein [Hyphomonadaceae bacterium]